MWMRTVREDGKEGTRTRGCVKEAVGRKYLRRASTWIEGGV